MNYKMNVAFVLLLCASSAFAWPWSGSGEKKVSAEDQARIKDSLQMEEVRNLQREVDALTRIRLQKADSLEKLEAEGLVRRYALDDRGSACWQYAGTDGAAGACRHHFHLKCTECGTLFHLNCDHLQEIAAHVASEHGFCIDPARTVFYGICADCAVLNEQKEGTENNETENL